MRRTGLFRRKRRQVPRNREKPLSRDNRKRASQSQLYYIDNALLAFFISFSNSFGRSYDG